VATIRTAAALFTLIVSTRLFAQGEGLPRFTVVDYFAVGGGAVGADALNQANVFTEHTVTGIWAVDARTGDSRQIDSCGICYAL
jgi:hypothetical protein